MADDSLEYNEELDFHSCNVPFGTQPFLFDDITADQQHMLNSFKIETVREDEKYLASHPEIRGIINVIMRRLFQIRPSRDIQQFIARYFLRPVEDISEEVRKIISTRKDHRYEGDSAVKIRTEPSSLSRLTDEHRVSFLRPAEIPTREDPLAHRVSGSVLEEAHEETTEQVQTIVENIIEEILTRVERLINEPSIKFIYMASSDMEEMISAFNFQGRSKTSSEPTLSVRPEYAPPKYKSDEGTFGRRSFDTEESEGFRVEDIDKTPSTEVIEAKTDFESESPEKNGSPQLIPSDLAFKELDHDTGIQIKEDINISPSTDEVLENFPDFEGGRESIDRVPSDDIFKERDQLAEGQRVSEGQVVTTKHGDIKEPEIYSEMIELTDRLPTGDLEVQNETMKRISQEKTPSFEEIPEPPEQIPKEDVLISQEEETEGTTPFEITKNVSLNRYPLIETEETQHQQDADLEDMTKKTFEGEPGNELTKEASPHSFDEELNKPSHAVSFADIDEVFESNRSEGATLSTVNEEASVAQETEITTDEL